MVVVLHGTLFSGASIVTLPKFEPELFLKTMAERQVTLGFLVPPIVLFLAKHPLVRHFDLSALRFTPAATPVTPVTPVTSVSHVTHVTPRYACYAGAPV